MASSPRIDELRKKFEENPRRYFAPLANEYRKAGDVQQAIAICREYLPQQPGHMSGHIVFGQALYEARTFDEAKAVFETALSLDPENLIALRHLGDIALITGDTEDAKVWYKRVLEADPRNEEIQAQLATIEQASASAPTPAITPAVPPPAAAAATQAAPSPAAPTVVMKAVQPPLVVTATSPTAEINLDAITPAPPVPAAAPSSAESPAAAPTLEVPPMVPPSVTQAAPATLEGLEGTQPAGAGDTPISSFSLDGLETTSLSTESARPAPAAPLADLDFGPAGAPPPLVEPASVAGTVDLDFAAPAPPAPAPAAAAPEQLPDLDFTTPPAAPPPVAAAPAPSIDASEAPALDLDLGSLGAPAAAAPMAAAPPPPPPAPVASAQDEAPLDLEISLPPATPSVPPAPEPAAAAPAPAAAPPTAPPVAAAPPVAPPAPEIDIEPAAPAATSAPFVTETMADLYVQQGHRDEALRVYRALLEQRPGDAGILGKIARLEGRAAPVPAPPAAPSGPSIRELLLAIATRRPGYRPDVPSGNGVHASGAAPAAAVAMEPPANLQSRSDALGASLGFGSASPQDEAAAHVLARAFVRNGREAGASMAGAPARPATDDLSLRTVFRDAEPAPPPSSFSFDQFFSQRASAEGQAMTAQEGQAAESAEDVAQFTQWLEGLKKR